MRFLGIDPGPAKNGYCAIDAERGGRPSFVSCGEVASSGPEIALLLERLRPAVVAIERPVWQDHGHDLRATRAVASNLIDTNYVVGRIAGLAIAGGARLVEIPAQAWRLGLLRTRSPSDAQVKAWAYATIERLPARSNVHERDAAGVAVAATRIAWDENLVKKYASGF